jgi:hypothetical protein
MRLLQEGEALGEWSDDAVGIKFQLPSISRWQAVHTFNSAGKAAFTVAGPWLPWLPWSLCLSPCPYGCSHESQAERFQFGKTFSVVHDCLSRCMRVHLLRLRIRISAQLA